MFERKELARLVGEITDQIAAARQRIETLKQQRDALDTDPLPKADLIIRLSECVDARIAEFDANLQTAVERIIHRPGLDISSLPGGFPFFTPMNGDGRLDHGLIEAMLAEALKKRTAAVINRMDWPTPGPSARDRLAARVRLTREIEAAEAELAAIVATARAAGLNLS